MYRSVKSLLESLKPDPWRREVGFTEDIEATNGALLNSTSVEEITAAVNKWLFANQPCLFGRIAARRNLISYCILTEEDLNRPDREIREKIQLSRTAWYRDAINGDKSAFIILALSEVLACAAPGADLQQLAQRLCSLYLLTDIEPDRVYLDQLELEIPSRSGIRMKWNVGVNYFSAQGDKRWWHDHRFPGGLAFSMNSVGHMAKSGELATAMKELQERLKLDGDEWIERPVDSLERALILAMKTIAQAANTEQGKATLLRPTSEDLQPRCPVELPPDLARFDFCSYEGFYHTDHTIPSVYFDPSALKPTEAGKYNLDFTYLFHEAEDNLDYFTTSQGIRVETDAPMSSVDEELEERLIKRRKAHGSTEVDSSE